MQLHDQALSGPRLNAAIADRQPRPDGPLALGIIGIGNPLAGDDGAGIVALQRLRSRLGPLPELFYHCLSGDLFEMADLLGRSRRFIFLDALAGESPGEIRTAQSGGRALSSSLHQTDINAAMRCLASLGLIEPFPSWEVWGVTIRLPEEFSTRLSPAVERAVDALVERLAAEILQKLG